MREQEPHSYELTYLTREEDAAFLAPLLQAHGAAFVSERPPEKVRLQYPVKKQLFAFLGSGVFQAPPGAIQPLRAALGLEDRVLRFLITEPIVSRREPEGEGRTRRSAPEPEGERAASPEAPSPRSAFGTLTNEALQRTIEEILQ